MNRTPLIASALLALILGGVTGCGDVSTNPVAGALPAVFADSAFGCGDARGDNSTGKELIDSATAYSRRAMPIMTGAMDDAPAASSASTEMATNLENVFSESGVDVDDVAEKALAETRVKLDGMVVPDGGDAAFAEVACSAPPEALLDDLPLFQITRYDIGPAMVRAMTGTPHYIRSTGRAICLSAADSEYSGQEFIEQSVLSADERAVLEDPSEALQKLLDGVDEARKGLSDGGAADMMGGAERVEWDLNKAQKKLESYEDDPTELADLVRSRITIARAALEHQCPGRS